MRDKRPLLIITACVVCTSILAVAILYKQKNTPTIRDFNEVTVTVKEGETAWEIARRYCPDTLDVREYLDWCEAANETSMGLVEAGKSYIFYAPKGDTK